MPLTNPGVGTKRPIEPLLRRTLNSRQTAATADGRATMFGTILVILLILALVGAFPRWSHSSGWGYGLSGIVGVLLLVVSILALTGRV